MQTRSIALRAAALHSSVFSANGPKARPEPAGNRVFEGLLPGAEARDAGAAALLGLQGRFERRRGGRYGGIRYGFRRARSRLYRSQILQVNMRLKALVEIYTMHSFAQLQNHIFFKKLVEFAKICENFQKFCEIRNFSNRFFAKILRLQRCKRMQIL